MRIYMMTDIEGVAGVVSFESQSYAEGKYYEQARQLLTAETNAAVEGLYEGGATDILVVDGHGPGAIVFEQLDARVRLLHGRPITATQSLRPMWDCDAVVIIGQHARAGVATGNLNHSLDSRRIDRIQINGREVGEIGLLAACAGVKDIPMIFVSGDEDACEEARQWIPDISTVAVKQGVARNVAISISATESRRRIRQGIAQAMHRHQRQPVRPVKLPPPYIVEVKYFHTNIADQAEQQGARRIDALTVSRQSSDILEVIYR